MKNSENQFFVFWQSTRKTGKSIFITTIITILSLMILFPVLYSNWADFIDKPITTKLSILVSAIAGSFLIAFLSWYINEKRYNKMKKKEDERV